MVNANSVVPSIGSGAVPTGLKIGGLTEEEWSIARECQKKIDALNAKWPPTAQEIAQLEQLQDQRNALWKKAVGIPGLTAGERERLRIKLYTRDLYAGDSVPPTVTPEQIKQWTTRPPPPPPDPKRPLDKPAPDQVNPVWWKLMCDFTTEQSDTAVEQMAEQYSEENLRKFGDKFGDFLGVGRIAVAYKEGGIPSAISETGDFLVGKISLPQASFALEGGRVYSNLNYQLQNKFMSDAMRALNSLDGKSHGEFDEKKFWSNFDDDCTIGQKATRKWVSYGAE